MPSDRLQVERSAIQNHLPDFAEHVENGLSASPKKLSPMYLYDEQGSLLFEQICELPEYYLTRTEHAILQNYSDEVAAFSNGNMALVELGSGSSTKTRLIIEALIAHQSDLHYIPVDISETILVNSAKELLQDYPDLKISAHAAEYHAAIRTISKLELEQKMIIFLGSNIGNFEPDAAKNFLCKVRTWLSDGDFFLLSTDLEKERSVLEPAYDDAQGVTAAFNMNLLKRMNEELDANFDLSTFSHYAFYNEKLGRVESHLRSHIEQSVYFGRLNRTFHFKKAETIHTENSYKFTNSKIRQLCEATGFRLVKQWQDERTYFSVNLLATE